MFGVNIKVITVIKKSSIMLHIYHPEESDLKCDMAWVLIWCLFEMFGYSFGYFLCCHLLSCLHLSSFQVLSCCHSCFTFYSVFTSCLCLLSFVIVCPTCVLFRLQRSDEIKVSRVPDWVPLALAQNRKLRL